MVRGAGFEPALNASESADCQSEAPEQEWGYTQIGAQIPDADRLLLTRVVAAWPSLNSGLKLAILAIVDSSSEGGAK
jgi:hypothetical protein